MIVLRYRMSGVLQMESEIICNRLQVQPSIIPWFNLLQFFSQKHPV